MKLHQAIFVATVFFVVTGCQAPRVAITSAEKLGTYQKVYLVAAPHDFHHAQPRIAIRLRTAGFEVVELKPDSPPVESQGSGFVLTPAGHVLTALHVLANKTNATVWIQGKRHVGHVTATDTNLDAAIIVLEDQPAPFRPLPFAPDAPCRMGQDVYSMGFPLADTLGTEPRLSKGLVSATVGLEDDPRQVQISVEVQPGSSGGPLLNERGEAVGMVVSTLNPARVFAQTGGKLPQNVNFASKAASLNAFLRASGVLLPVLTNQTSGPGIVAAEQSIALVRAGIVEDKGLKQPSAYCFYAYSCPDTILQYFRAFVIQFNDARTGAILFRGTHGENQVHASENAVLDRIFEEVSGKFFPDRPNPFKHGK
jgi:hypothetical protein